MAVAVEQVKGHNGHTAAPINLEGFAKLRMSDSEKHTFTMNLPVQLRDLIRSDAEKRRNPATGSLGVPDNAIAREILAYHYGLNIVDNLTPRLKKGLTKEEKAAARAQTRARVSAIMEALASGKLSEDVLKAAGVQI